MTALDDPAAGYFRCSDRERAAFEAGIKLGALYHQFTGAPVSRASAPAMERAIERSVLVQPFVESVKVRINRKTLKRGKGRYGYRVLEGRMLDVSVMVRVGAAKVRSRLRHIPELDYPLMYVTGVTETWHR